jgi:hypothetical protein
VHLELFIVNVFSKMPGTIYINQKYTISQRIKKGSFKKIKSEQMNIKRGISTIFKGLIFLKYVIIQYVRLILLVHTGYPMSIKIFLNLNLNSDED